MKSFPELINDKIYYYQWRAKIRIVNRYYTEEFFLVSYWKRVSCNILGTCGLRRHVSVDFSILNKAMIPNSYYDYNHRQLDHFSYYYNNIGYINVWNKKQKQFIKLHPRYIYSIDPPERAMREYELNKPPKIYVKPLRKGYLDYDNYPY